jgi:MscS family membrane protein
MTACRSVPLAAAFVAVVLLAAPASAQLLPGGGAEPSSGGTADEPESDAAAEVSNDSPRASLREFLSLTRRRRYEEASLYLVAPGTSAQQAADLARRLRDVLEHRLWLDLDDVSGASSGSTGDGLPPNVEQLGVIELDGRERPVRLVRVTDASGSRWAFSQATVERVTGWYAELPNRWLVDRLPPWLLREAPLGLQWWQWIGIAPLLLACWFGGHLLGRITQAALSRVVARTRRDWDDRLLALLRGPLTLGWSIVLARAVLPLLSLPIPAERVAAKGLKALVMAALFWAAWRSIDVLAGGVMTLSWTRSNASALNLLKVGTNILKGVVAAMGIVAVLAGLGLPVGTLLAGVGIGSLAIAFGAQRTVENLFGSIALAIDQPFRVGDEVKVEDFQGIVENIGLRSTRFRTKDRTIISMPNGLVANMRLETLASRDRMRFHAVLGLVQEADRGSVERVIGSWRAHLQANPNVLQDPLQVHLTGIGESTLDVEIQAWFLTPSWAQFLQWRQELLLDLLELAAREGVGFAYPTRTVILSTQHPAQSPSPAGPALLPPSSPVTS